jgi:hypothetical protein
MQTREVYAGFTVAEEVFEGKLKGNHAKYLCTCCL